MDLLVQLPKNRRLCICERPERKHWINFFFIPNMFKMFSSIKAVQTNTRNIMLQGIAVDRMRGIGIKVILNEELIFLFQIIALPNCYFVRNDWQVRISNKNTAWKLLLLKGLYGVILVKCYLHHWKCTMPFIPLEDINFQFFLCLSFQDRKPIYGEHEFKT